MKGGEGREMEGREERRGEGKGREGRRKTKSGYAYVRQTHRHTKVKTVMSASFTPFTWRI